MRRFLALLICVLLSVSCAFAPSAFAQDYPTKPIRIIVPFGPGGGGDIVGRIFGQALQEKLGQAVVIENKPGAAGTIGNEAVARAERDGYTIGVMTAGQIIAGAMNKSLRYDTATAFEPIGMVATASLMIVARPDFPANNIKELIAAAKANPGKINVASPGFGATQHMSGELFKQTAGIDMVSVQFRTSPQVQSGQLKAIAVTTKDRFPIVPDVPAAAESGLLPGYDVATWYGFFGPRGIPPAIVARLNKALNESLKDPSVRDKLIKAGVEPKGSTPEEFGTFMAGELARWNKVRETAGIEKQ